MAVRGAEGATIADIAARAGVSPGTFYNYFRDLPTVLDALVDELIGHIDELLAEVGPLDRSPCERFAVGVDLVLRLADEDPVLAWCLVRLVPTVARLRDSLGERVALSPTSTESPGPANAWDAVSGDVLIGTIVSSMRSRLSGRAGPSHNRLVVEALLRALGLPADQARSVSDILRRQGR